MWLLQAYPLQPALLPGIKAAPGSVCLQLQQCGVSLGSRQGQRGGQGDNCPFLPAPLPGPCCSVGTGVL